MGNSGEQELPSHEQLIQHTPNQGTMKARMDVHSMEQFANTQSDRSELGMSGATSVGLPGMGTLKAGIAFNNPAAAQQQARQNAE